MAYRSLVEVLAGFVTRLDTPPSSRRHHPDSRIARKLHLIATMRSNDAYRGFPGDVFAFTFFQELAARTLNLDVGTYKHFVGSFHLYDDDVRKARAYLGEGFHSPISMPPMPKGDPWASVEWLIQTEQAIRCDLPEPSPAGIDSYWLDLARLLRIKKLSTKRDLRQLVQVKNEMASPVYNAFIRGRQVALQRSLETEPELPGILPPIQATRT